MSQSKYHKEMTLNEWASMFRAIYFPTQNYNRSKTEIFTHLVKVFGGGSRYLFRTSDPDGSRDFLARIFGWYCALANRIGIDIERTLWSKYPGVCPRCVQRVCGCERTPKDIDVSKLALLASSHSHEMPRTVREWQAMFANMYRGPSGREVVAASRERLALIFSRMAEELGEVAEALLLDNAIDKDVDAVLQNEMADLCAWIFALANNLQYVDPSASGVTLADVSWNLYGGKCHKCQKLPCGCVSGSFSLELAGRGAMGPAHWDERTGLANSEGMQVHIRAANDKYKNKPSEWSLVMFDLDDFGKVNKEYGNLVGDIVLQTASERMRGQLKDKEFAFRRGGEEFVVVLDGNMESASELAERIRRALAETPVVVSTASVNTEIRMSASFGVANTFSDGKTPLQLEEVADERMRKAKRDGKNRVEPAVSAKSLEFLESRKHLGNFI